MPFTDVKPDDPHWEAIQKVGVTGILKGTGKPEGWANKMMFYPDSLMTISELEKGIKSLPGFNEMLTGRKEVVTLKELIVLINKLHRYLRKCCNHVDVEMPLSYFNEERFREMKLEPFETGKKITRKEIAVILNYVFDFFEWFDVDVYGNLSKPKFKTSYAPIRESGKSEF
jgi:hypothetical protein